MQSKGESETKPLPLENPENTEEPVAPFSVIAALNRLKEAEDRLYLAKHRLDIIQNKQEKAFNQSMDNERRYNLYRDVSDFAASERAIKQANLQRRSSQLEQLRLKNLHKRETHQQIMKGNKEQEYELKKGAYVESKKTHQQNEKLIKSARLQELELKQKNRRDIYHLSKERINYVNEYRRNKKLLSLLNKEQEIYEMQNKIMERESKINDFFMEADEASNELNQFVKETNVARTVYARPKVIQTSPLSLQKSFRVKYRSNNQTTVVLQ